MDKNKVRYGLKNVHYAPLTIAADGTPSYETPVRIPGAVTLALNKNSSRVMFAADDDKGYFELDDNTSFDGDLAIALIPESFRTGPLGEVKDDNGVLVTEAEHELAPFALLFEFTGDKRGIRHVVYNCTASEDEMSGETRGENTEVHTETLKLSARNLPNKGKVKAKTGDTTSSTVYDNWYNEVYLPTFTASGGTSGDTEEETGDGN